MMEKKQNKLRQTVKTADGKTILKYVLLLEFLLVLCVYLFVFNKYNEQTENLRSQNNALFTRNLELKTKYDKMEENKADIERMKSEITDILEAFPADVLEEDILMLAVDTVNKADVGYKSINASDRISFYEIDNQIISDAEIDELTEAISFGKRTVKYANITDYSNLKEIIRTIQSADGKVVINNISYTKNDEDVCLEGTIEVINYYVNGTGKEYKPRRIPGYEAGLADLFRLYDVSDEEVTTDL